MYMKPFIISGIIGIFIYFRKLDYYKVIPRKNIYSSCLISAWTYLSIIEPWFILVGLGLVNYIDSLSAYT